MILVKNENPFPSFLNRINCSNCSICLNEVDIEIFLINVSNLKLSLFTGSDNISQIFLCAVFLAFYTVYKDTYSDINPEIWKPSHMTTTFKNEQTT